MPVVVVLLLGIRARDFAEGNAHSVQPLARLQACSPCQSLAEYRLCHEESESESESVCVRLYV